MPIDVIAAQGVSPARKMASQILREASGERAVARCDLLGAAPYSDSIAGLVRTYLSPAYGAAQRCVAQWMADAGMVTRVDAAGNLIGRYEGVSLAAPLLIGSHLDSVLDAGRYDGPLGLMLGIECVAALHTDGRRLPFAIEVIAFGDEEGSRFPAAMLTSRAVAGTLDLAMLEAADAEGVTLAAALDAAGLDIARFAEARRPAGSVLAYLEAHIEQGPALEVAGLPVGVVTGIAAQLRHAVTVRGRAGHAGTTAMSLRADALAAAAEMVLAAERIAREGPDGLVATVGRLEVLPGAPNVVPGRVAFTLDIRAGGDGVRDAAAAAIFAAFATIADRRRIDISVSPLQDLAASPCDPTLTEMMAEAVAELGIEARRLVSGAGHDAMIMAALCPTVMLFVRCDGGISHNPAERVTTEDADVALQAMLGFLDRLAATHG